MGFDAGKAVAPLEWDFSTFGQGQGVSPEPTTAQIEHYHRQMRNIAEALIRVQTASVQTEADRLAGLDLEQAKQELERWAKMDLETALEVVDLELSAAGTPTAESLLRRMAQLVDEVTGGCPGAEQIMALPHRPRSAFFGWFSGQLINPEFEAAGTKPSLSLVQNG